MKKANTQSHIESLDELALLIKAGFDGVSEQFASVDERFNGLETAQHELKTKVESGFKTVEERLDRIDTNQEYLKLRQDNMAYRFELNELNQRVLVLETHAGLAK